MSQIKEESPEGTPDELQTGIEEELSSLVDQGLLKMGVNLLGEAVFWPTELGAEVLGMEMA